MRHLACFDHVTEPSSSSAIAIQKMCSTFISECDDLNDPEGSEHMGEALLNEALWSAEEVPASTMLTTPFSRLQRHGGLAALRSTTLKGVGAKVKA